MEDPLNLFNNVARQFPGKTVWKKITNGNRKYRVKIPSVKINLDHVTFQSWLNNDLKINLCMADADTLDEAEQKTLEKIVTNYKNGSPLTSHQTKILWIFAMFFNKMKTTSFSDWDFSVTPSPPPSPPPSMCLII